MQALHGGMREWVSLSLSEIMLRPWGDFLPRERIPSFSFSFRVSLLGCLANAKIVKIGYVAGKIEVNV